MNSNRGGIMKPYNIYIDEAENSASVDMYGEVVESVPVNPWTGQVEDGLFIVLKDFLADLEGLVTKDNITVHINSVGGDLYAGVSIYNRLKALPGNVTTINDGLAASAGSLIFQAGNTRKVNAGSNIMLHQAMGLLLGYYNTTDLKQIIKQLDAGNKAAVNIYSEASGRTAEAMKALVDKETWLTGQEAVDAGLADEVIDSGTPVTMSLTADRSHMMVNGVSLSTRGMSNIPAGIPVLPAQNFVSPAASAPVEDKNTMDERSPEPMEVKNVDELRAAFPELLAQVEATAREDGRASGIEAERARIQGIEAIENAIADKALIDSAKFGDTPLTAEQLAFKAMQAQAAIGATVLRNMAQDGAESGADGVAAAPNNGPETEGGEDVDPEKEIADAVNLFNKMRNGGVK